MTKEEIQLLRDIMQEEIGAALKPIDGRLDKIEVRLDGVETETRHTRMLMEQQEHNVQLIAEQYGDISTKLERVREIDELEDRLRTVETVVMNHTAAIKELRKAE